MGATIFKHTPTPIMSGGAAQDHSGFLWIGTQSGLLRWDGYTYRHYTADSSRPRAIPDNFIRRVHVDRRGTLWVGTSSGGMARYDALSDDFTVFGTGPAALSDVHVSAFADDDAGGVWIGTASGLDHITADGKLSRASDSILPPSPHGSPARAIEVLLRDRNGGMWIGTRQGLLLRAAGGAGAVPVNIDSAGEKQPTITVLIEDSAGRMWIGTRNMGAFVIQPGSNQAVAVRESGPAAALHQQRVFSIAEVSPSEIWIGTEGGGIVALDPVSGLTRRIRHRPDAPDSLDDNDAHGIFRERGGMVLVGTTAVTSLYDPRPQAVVTVRDIGLPLVDKLTVPSLLVRPNGHIWVGVAGGGIDIIDPQQGGIGQILPGKAGGLPTGRVLAMDNGPDGEVFIGTQQGLYRMDADGKRLRQVQIAERSPTAPAWALAWRDGVLWMGGLDGLWALTFGADGASPTVARHERAALGDGRVTSILPIENGALWIGTRAGLAYLPSPTAPVELLPTDAGANDRLLPGFTSSLALDQRGRLWISTFGRGIQVLTGTDADGRRRFRRLETANGLPDNSVNAVLPDLKGAMWASTDRGLARIDPATFAIRVLGPADGVHITQYWTNAAARTVQGELLFGGIDGLTVVRPDRLSDILYQPPIVVTDIALNDQPVSANRFNQPLAASAKPGPIEITPAGKERGFSLEFAALDYSASDRAQYSYRLAGFDSDWIRTVPGSRRISYNNLPPGTYSLQLRAATRDGVWSPALSVPVQALPSWHQMAWVRALFVLLAFAAVAWLVRLRTAFYRRRQAELESMVAQRTAELSASQVMLEQLAYADPLTGLPNRRMFSDELRGMRAQSAREHTPFALLLIDLDHFKQVNDTLGHDAGDALLVEVAKRLRLAVRETDRLARLGGDEFAVLLSNTCSEEDVNLVARRIVDSVAEPIPFGVHSMKVGASIGAAAFRDYQGGDEALYKEADLALYQAKSSGRNTWVLYRQGDREELATSP